MQKELRPHQVRAINELREALRETNRVMCQAPTGFGKTVIAAAITERVRERNKRVLFTVPRIELIDQTIERFAADGITDVGVIQANHWMTDWSKPIQIASIHTLKRRTEMPEINLALIDEAHFMNKFYEPWFKEAKYPIIGLSATPGARGLGKLYHKLIRPVGITELINEGWLSPFTVFAPRLKPDLKGVKTGMTELGKDYNEKQLAEVMSQKELVADVVDTWSRLGEGRSTLCFAVNRAHARYLQDCFLASGVSCGYIDCETPPRERREIREKFASGDLKIVTNVDVLGVGVDWDVRCIILARPTRSKMRHVQTIGRGLRLAEGKDRCIILDHGASHFSLGMVTDIEFELDDGTKKESIVKREPPLPKECKQCHAIVSAGLRKCPNCGFEWRIEAQPVRTINGELAEYNGESVKLAKKANREATAEDKRNFMGELVWIRKERNYAEGWTSQQYRKKFGVWPHGSYIRYAPPRVPSQETRQWVRHTQIQWRHSSKNPLSAG